MSRHGSLVSRLRHLTSRRSVRWPGRVLLIAFGAVLLLALAPLLLLVATALLLLAWRAPHRVQPLLRVRLLRRVPAWLRVSPMRFAATLFVLTLPLAAVSQAITGDTSGSPSSTDTGRNDQVSDRLLSPLPAVNPTLRAELDATRRATARATPRLSASPTPAVTATPEATATVGGELAVHFLDVGQGDATLLIGPGVTMLIDVGRHDRNDVVPMLTSFGVDSIDVVAITHGHADHIGQLDRVLQAFDVEEVWMSGTPHTTQTFDRAITALEQSDAQYEEPRAGTTTTVGPLVVEIVNPDVLTGDLDADSLAMRIRYGSVSFLFTGDMRADVEAAMVTAFASSLDATIFQVGHHGSSSSNSVALLAAVTPDVAIFSAAASNQYGHPHPEALHRLADAGAEIYGTATHATVAVITDGATYRIETGRPVAPAVPVVPQPPPAAPAPTPAPPDAGCRPGQVDINSAPFEQLLLIIHIGPDRAQQILNLRPFSSVDTMERIDGIGPARLADIKAEGIACVP